MLIPHPRILAKYFALRIPPGTPVRYFGSFTAKHGVFTAEPCNCTTCFRDISNGIHATRYALYESGKPSGVHHVRHTSVIPDTGSRQAVTDWLSEDVTETHLMRELEKEFPGAGFCVSVTGRQADITWKGGPLENAVKTICAPTMATYAYTPSDAPMPVHLIVQGRKFYGTPRASKIELFRIPDLT